MGPPELASGGHRPHRALDSNLGPVGTGTTSGTHSRAPGSLTSSSHFGVFSGVVGPGETERTLPSPAQAARCPQPLRMHLLLGLGSNTLLTLLALLPAPRAAEGPDEDGIPAAQLLPADSVERAVWGCGRDPG